MDGRFPIISLPNFYKFDYTLTKFQNDAENKIPILLNNIRLASYTSIPKINTQKVSIITKIRIILHVDVHDQQPMQTLRVVSHIADHNLIEVVVNCSISIAHFLPEVLVDMVEPIV